MKIKRNVYRYVLIFIIMCLELQCIYLLPASWTMFGLDCQGICIVIEIGCFLYHLVIRGGKIYFGKFHWIIWMGLVLVITSSLAGKISYGQSVLSGLMVQRARIANFLFFFTVYAWYKENKITISGIKKTIIAFAIICGAIYAVQFVLSNRVIFTYSTTNQKIRYGSVRFWFNTVYMVITSAMALDNIMTNKKAQWKDMVLLILPIFVTVAIIKSRVSFLSTTMAMLICFFIHKGSGYRKIFGIAVVIIGFIILSSTYIGQDLSNIVYNGVSQEDTFTVRNLGRSYYLLKTSEKAISIILGCGYASSSNNVALNMAYPYVFNSEYGYNVMLYPQDNGIFGQFYFYGTLGVFWWLCVLITFTKYGLKAHKQTGKTLFLFFVVFEVGFSITSIPTLFGSKLIISLLIIMLTDECRLMVNSRS